MANLHFEYPLIIREKHLDTFGHVNNATYLELLEEARWELITSRGFGLKDIQERKIGPVVVEVDIRFKRELLLREEVQITVELDSYRGKIGVLRQKIIKSHEELAAEAKVVFGLFDMQKRKLIAPTPEWLHAIGASETV